MKLQFETANLPGRWFEWPHAELPPDHLLTAPSIRWGSPEAEFQKEVNKVIELAHARIAAAVHAPFEREAFERWAASYDLPIVRPYGYDQVYPSPTTQAAWAAWLARSSVSANGDGK